MNAVFRRYVHSSCRIINYSKHSPCISARVNAKYFSTEEKLDHVAQKAYDTKVRLKLAADAGISVGGFYNNLVYKGKKGNRLGLGDLRNLLMNCVEPEHATFIRLAVQLYQRKGQDFSEEVGAQFIKACLRVNDPKLAGELIAKYKNRIGAWVTKKPLYDLFQALSDLNEVEMMVTISEVVHLKGNHAINSVDTMELVVKSASASNDLSLHNRSVEIATKILSADVAELDRIVGAYAAPVVEAVEDSEGGITEEGDGEGATEEK